MSKIKSERNLEQWFKRKIKSLDSKDSRLECVMLDALETICRVMKKEKVTQTELARRLGTSRSFISKLLHGHPNMTIYTLFKIADALNRDLKIDFVKKETERTNGI